MTSEGLPLNALRAFAAIHANGGVRAAARELAISHSSVSRHLAELEHWLGVALVEPTRGRGGARFTPAGDALGEVTRRSLDDIARVVASLREARSDRSVTIATSPSVAARWLLPRLAALEAAHRGVEVSVVVDQRLHDLSGGAIDLAIRMGDGRWPDVTSVPLMGDALYPVMSPAAFARARRPHRPADLTRLRLLHDRDPGASWESWRRAHGPRTLDVRKGPRFASTDLVLRAAVQGLGVALARDRLARDDLAAGALIRPLGTLEVVLPTAYWIVVPVGVHPRAQAREVIAWLQRQT